MTEVKRSIAAVGPTSSWDGGTAAHGLPAQVVSTGAGDAEDLPRSGVSGRGRRRGRQRRLARIGVTLACAAGFFVVAPASPASAEVARGIYTSLAKCRTAGFIWVALPHFETFECRGFYSAGHGGWRLYIE